MSESSVDDNSDLQFFVIRTLTFQTNNPGDSLTLSVEVVCIDGLELCNCNMIKRILPALQESVNTLSCICQLHTTLLPCFFFFFFSLAYCSLPSDQGSSLDYLMVLSLSVLALSGNMLINCYFIWYLSHYSQLQPGFAIPTSWTHEEALAPGYWFTAQSQHSGILFDSVPVILLPLCLLLPAWSLFHSVVLIHPHLVIARSQFTSSLLPNKFSSVPPNNSYLVATLQKWWLRQLLTLGVSPTQCCCGSVQRSAHNSFSMCIFLVVTPVEESLVLPL